MRHFMFAVITGLVSVGCSAPTPDPTPRACYLEWLGPEIETACQNRLEVSSRYLVLWISTWDGHVVMAAVRGRFPENLEGPQGPPIAAIYIAIETHEGDDYWCTSERSPMPCGLTIKLDGDRAVIAVETYVSNDGEGWRYMRVITEVDVTWIEG